MERYYSQQEMKGHGKNAMLESGLSRKVCKFLCWFFHKCKSILLSTDLSSPLLIAKAEIALAIALFRFSSHLFRYLLIRS